MPGVRTTKPFSSMRMTRRFQSNVSGNWTLTSPISIGSEVRDVVDVGASLELFPNVGVYSSSLTGELRAPMMLRREVDVMDDIRRMRREARDAFLSSEVGDADWAGSLVLGRDDRESRLPGRDDDGRPDPVDDIDMLRSSGREASAIDAWDDGGSSAISCSTVNGLAWRPRTSDSEGSTPEEPGEISESRTMRAVTETEFARRMASTDIRRGSWRLTLGARPKPSG